MAQRIGIADVVVGGILVSAFVGVAAAAVSMQRETANRVGCARNLMQVGQSILLYSNENRNAYPRTRYDPAKPPTWGTPYADEESAVAVPGADPFADEKKAAKEVLDVRPEVNDVTACLFLLLRTQDIRRNHFLCPSARGTPIDFQGGDASQFTNFAGRDGIARHLSYSYQNPYASTAAIGLGFKLNNAITAEFAVMADMNPGGDALLTLKATSSRAELKKGNSLNHSWLGSPEGQNVLYGDGHVEYQTSPFVGVSRDNIYVANDGRADGQARQGDRPRDGNPLIVASPADANDSILLPTAADVGADQPPTPVAEAKEAGPILARIKGTYTRVATMGDAARGGPPAGTVTMTIDDATVSVAGPGGSKANYPFTLAGLRDERSIVLKLAGADAGEADLTFVEDRLYVESDEPTGLLKGAGGAGEGWKREGK